MPMNIAAVARAMTGGHLAENLQAAGHEAAHLSRCAPLIGSKRQSAPLPGSSASGSLVWVVFRVGSALGASGASRPPE
jgi:hypothetical protein